MSVTGTVYADTEMEFLSGQDSKKLENLRVFGTGHVNDFIAANQTRIAAGSVALALKGVNSLISHKQHRSGDSYYNENLNISRKAISYGMALTYGAKLGPGGLAFVAAGIAVNESINAFTEASNFKYDRMMDKEYVHNIKAVAGDISYGRRRRGDR